MSEDLDKEPLARRATVRHFDVAAMQPHACPACGLQLFGACVSCSHLQIAHLEHCTDCGKA